MGDIIRETNCYFTGLPYIDNLIMSHIFHFQIIMNMEGKIDYMGFMMKSSTFIQIKLVGSNFVNYVKIHSKIRDLLVQNAFKMLDLCLYIEKDNFGINDF